GVPSDQLDRVRVPAGLDLGRTSHQEIAVAILAELVQLRAAGALSPVPLAQANPAQANPAQANPAAANPAQANPSAANPAQAHAVDPVVRITVTGGPAGHPLAYDGITYYFCRAG